MSQVINGNPIRFTIYVYDREGDLLPPDYDPDFAVLRNGTYLSSQIITTNTPADGWFQCSYTPSTMAWGDTFEVEVSVYTEGSLAPKLTSLFFTVLPNAADIRNALGLASANADTQLTAILTEIGTRLATSSYVEPANSTISDIFAQLQLTDTDVATILSKVPTPTDELAIRNDQLLMKAVLDQFRFTTTNQVDANALTENCPSRPQA